MNYYLDWWNNARNQKALILTKPVERKLLLKRIKKLEEGEKGKAFKELEIERNDFRSELGKSKEEIKTLTETNTNLTEQITKKDTQLKKLASELLENEKEFLETETNYRKELKDQETNYKERFKKQKNLSAKINQESREELTTLKATLTKGQKALQEELKEKDNLLKTEQANSRSITQKLKEEKEAYKLEKELLTKEITTLTTNNTNLNNQVATLATQKATAKPAFEALETIIAKNRVLLFPIKKKLRNHTEEIKTAFSWGKTLKWDLGEGSTTTLPDEKDKELEKLGKEEQRKSKNLDMTEEKKVTVETEVETNDAQEYLDKHYPKEERGRVEELHIEKKKLIGDMDLSDFVDLKKLGVSNNELTNVNFLKTLPHPEKLNFLFIYSNNIEPTDIAVFKPFIYLYWLKIGTLESSLEKKRNKFFGSFESWKGLTKLTSICIEATDVDRGLEYLPMSLGETTKKLIKKTTTAYKNIECSPHSTNAKCSQIQDQLRPFNYDLLAWQLAHPELMFKSHPEYFTEPNINRQWIEALSKKITETETELNQLKVDKPFKTKELWRLDSKLTILKEVKDQLKEESETLAEKETKWQNIHRQFTSPLIEEWEQKGFTYEKTLEWSSVWGKNFNPQDYEFVNWLQNIKKAQPIEILNKGDENDLRRDYKKFKKALSNFPGKLGF